MQKRACDKSIGHKIRFTDWATRGISLLLLFSFLLSQNVFGNSKNTESQIQKSSLQSDSDFAIISAENVIWQNHFSHFPLSSEPNEPNSLIENETESNSDNEIKFCTYFQTLLNSDIRGINLAYSGSFILSLLSRKIIPLFVLQHSWRTFISIY